MSVQLDTELNVTALVSDYSMTRLRERPVAWRSAFFSGRHQRGTLSGMASRNRTIQEMTDAELRALISRANVMEKKLTGGYSKGRRGWTGRRSEAEAELERRRNLT
jgi:hypothetical protein